MTNNNLQERIEESNERRRKGYVRMRLIYDVGMGAFIVCIGLLMLFGSKFDLWQIGAVDPLMRYMFGGLCLLYGGFRLYRGIKQDY